jgi:hypothetical protein
MYQQEDTEQAFLHIFEAIHLFAPCSPFLVTVSADTCEDKDLGHLSPSFLPAQFACEETMTQKTNGPGSLKMAMISLPVIFLLEL